MDRFDMQSTAHMELEEEMPVTGEPMHYVAEDPEEQIGQVLDDPWADPGQEDWPDEEIEVP